MSGVRSLGESWDDKGEGAININPSRRILIASVTRRRRDGHERWIKSVRWEAKGFVWGGVGLRVLWT